MMISSLGSISSSSSSATVRVEKATSEFLMGPDWTINIDICDTINSNQILAKDVVKAVKKRLQHKNPKVQLLALTLLETMVKNCGDYVHFQIAEKHILQDMVKIVKKRTDMHVRDKVLALIGSWHEAFGGSQGRYPQYIMAYEDLRRSGVQFPERSADATAALTPPATNPVTKQLQPGYGMPSSSSSRLDDAMASDANFSLSNINSMRDVLFLLADMLQAIDSSDRSAVKDEVIVELVEQCRANQKKLMDVLSTCGDEELLGQGLELNDDMQSVLARHDAIASGLPQPPASGSPQPQPPQLTNTKAPESEKLDNSSPRPTDVDVATAASNVTPSAAGVPAMGLIDEEEEEEDDFAQLARRHSKPRADASHHNDMASSSEAPAVSNALVPVTTSAPAAQSKEQDIIDLLSLTLTTSTATTTEQQTPVNPGMHSQPQVQTSSQNPGISYSDEATPGNPAVAFNSYVAPWAQPQPQMQPQFQSHPAPYMHPQQQPVNMSQFTSQPQTQSYGQYQQVYQPQLGQSQPAYQPQLGQSQPAYQPQFGQSQPVYQPQLGQSQSSYVNHQPAQQQYSAYPPPPWAATPGYYTNQNPVSRPVQTTYIAPKPTYESSINGETHANNSPRSAAAAPAAGGQKPFIPSYRLFEDLDVFGNADARFKAATSNASHSLSGSANQSMVGGRK